MKKANNTKKVLITGGGGYIGSVVTKYLLERGFDIRVLDLFIYGRDSLNDVLNDVEVVQGDIRDAPFVRKCLQGVGAVIHLAAIVGAPESNRIPRLTWKINCGATKHLVNEMKKSGISRMIFVSTCSNYGRSGDTFVSENAALDPISPYSESKVAAEEYILSQKDSNFHPVICRLATVFGVSPRMRFDLLVNQFVADAFLKKELIIFGHQGRTFVHIKDVARAFELLLQANIKRVSGEVFNVGSTENSNFTKPELGQIVAGLIPGAKLKVLKKDSDLRDYKVSFDKISRVFGFRTKYSIEDGVEEILEYLERNPGLDPYSPEYSNLNKYLSLG